MTRRSRAPLAVLATVSAFAAFACFGEPEAPPAAPSQPEREAPAPTPDPAPAPAPDPVPEAPAGVDWAVLEGSWHMDQEASGAVEGVDVYVPSSVDLGPARFRAAMSFGPGSQCTLRRLAPTDAHYFIEGTFTREGGRVAMTLSEKDGSTVEFDFDVLSLKPDRLELRPLSK